MVKRLLWLGVGLAVGALAVRAVTKMAHQYGPRGLAGSAKETAGAVRASVRSFIDDVREGMHEREEELRHAFAEGTPVGEPDEG